MAYEKYVWGPKEPITSEHLNRMEDGIAGRTGIFTDVRAFGILPGEDCSTAIQNALAISNLLYFPSGSYTFSDVVITQNTVFQLAPDAHLHTDTGRLLIAHNCSFSMYGGVISSGVEYPSRAQTAYTHESRALLSGQSGGIVELYGCTDCVFDSVKAPYSSSSSVFQIYGDSNGAGGNRPVTISGQSVVPGACRNIRFMGCSFNNVLLSAIHVLYHNKNIVMDGCTFTNVLRPVNSAGEEIAYCYGAFTGVQSVYSDKELYYTPTDGYVIRNCYVENCEGTGIDTHAASNVLYEGNILIDCDSFITAYHDYRRVRTADGWVMENITVRGNRCKTTKAFSYADNAYPHDPFLLYNNGPMHTMRNMIVENNVIDTNWYYTSPSGTTPWEIISLYYVDDVVLRNNTIISRADLARAILLRGCNNAIIGNLTLEGAFYDGVYIQTSVCRIGTIDCIRATFTQPVLQIPTGYFSVVDTDNAIINNPAATALGGWSYALNRHNRLLQAVETDLPFDGSTRATYAGFTGKNTINGATVASISGKQVTTGTYRLPIGARVALGTSAYHVMDVESYYNDSDVMQFVSILDRDVTDTSATAMYISAPQRSLYNATTT